MNINKSEGESFVKIQTISNGVLSPELNEKVCMMH